MCHSSGEYDNIHFVSHTKCNLISKFIFAQISVYAVRNNVVRPILNNNSVNRTSYSV